ncbi:MAG: peroxiredoxin-like family protein [Hyphomicrobium sp.]|nr:peroxiredoxin-like family protein [Hyphomicrobium sp.]
MTDAPLNQRLAVYATRLRELNFPFAEAYDDLVARLMSGQIGEVAPRPGDLMPPFILPDLKGRLVALDELTRRGPVVVSFNRGHWCPFCKIELRTLAAHHEDFLRYGASVVSILPDRQTFADKLSRETLGRLIILSDVDSGYSLTLALVMWLGDNLKSMMQGRGVHLDAIQGNDGWFVPLPATFVIGRDGRVISRHVDPDFRTRMDVEDIIAALKSTA